MAYSATDLRAQKPFPFHLKSLQPCTALSPRCPEPSEEVAGPYTILAKLKGKSFTHGVVRERGLQALGHPDRQLPKKGRESEPSCCARSSTKPPLLDGQRPPRRRPSLSLRRRLPGMAAIVKVLVGDRTRSVHLGGLLIL